MLQILSAGSQIRSRSSATFVIVAATLVSQWSMELAKHAPSLKVIIYHGPTRQKVRPIELLTADVVLTSYPMLRYISYVTDAIDWHRIVLDGACVPRVLCIWHV